MSQIKERELACANCGTEFSRPVHQLVDMENEADSEALWQLQNGTFNRVSCPKCGTAGFIPAEVALHIPAEELVLVYVPNVQLMDEQQLGQSIGPIMEEFIVSIPEERQADYMLQPIITDEISTLQAAARGEIVADDLGAEGDDYDDEFDDDDQPPVLTEEEHQAILARRELIQNLFQAADSLERISMMRNYIMLIDELFLELLAALAEQAETVQPDLVPILQKIINEAEVILASSQG
jgi:hypothetical protein